MTVLAHRAQLAIRHLRLPRLRLLKPSIVAPIAAVSTSITQAYRMAYVEPFKIRQHEPLISRDVELEGRDPDW
jgi:hypothetical protein